MIYTTISLRRLLSTVSSVRSAYPTSAHPHWTSVVFKTAAQGSMRSEDFHVSRIRVQHVPRVISGGGGETRPSFDYAIIRVGTYTVRPADGPRPSYDNNATTRGRTITLRSHPSTSLPGLRPLLAGPRVHSRYTTYSTTCISTLAFDPPRNIVGMLCNSAHARTHIKGIPT